MADHDYVIDNGSGSSVLADLNSLFEAIRSLNSHSTNPATTVGTVAYQLWVDTGNNLLKMRNASNNDWIVIGSTNADNLGLALLASPTFTGEVVFNSTGSIQLPAGTTQQRPGSPENGDLRYNSTEHEVEAYKNGAWSNVGSGQGAKGGDNGENAVFWENQQTVTHDYSITASRNAGSFGPVTIDANKTVTIPSTSSWTIV